MGALVYSQGALWTHSSLTNVSSAPFGNRIRSGTQSLALPSLVPHGGCKSGIAADPRNLNTRVSPPTSNSVRIRLPPSNSPSAMLISHLLDVFHGLGWDDFMWNRQAMSSISNHKTS